MPITTDMLNVQHVYDFALLERVPDNPTSLNVTARRLLSGPNLASGKSSTVGAVLSGKNIICTLGRQTQGTGARPHTHPNEQFNYILQGTMTGDIEGDRVFAPPGNILHTPGMAVHTGLACPEEDLVFLAIKDTRHGIVGPPVDGKYNGPNYLPGFGTRTSEPRQTTAEMIAEAARIPGPGKQYVYDMLAEAVTRPGPASVSVIAGSTLQLPAGVHAKLLTGEKLHVAVLRLAPGATLSAHAHDNEQLTFVVSGLLHAELEGEPLSVAEHCMLHVPPGMRHTLAAPQGALIIVAQDNHHSFAA